MTDIANVVVCNGRLQTRDFVANELQQILPRRFHGLVSSNVLSEAIPKSCDSIFSGPPGTGKTTMAIKIFCRHAYITGNTVGMQFISEVAFLQGLQRNMHEKTFDVQSVADASLLLLDDLLSYRHTDWSINQIWQLLSHRYDNMLPTLATTNASLDEFDDRFPAQLLSRLRTYKLYAMNGIDYRRGK